MSRTPRLVAVAATLALAGAGVVATSPTAEARAHPARSTSHHASHHKATLKAHHKSHHKAHHTKRHHAPRLPVGVLASDLFTPLSAAVATDGTSYVTSSFGGQILRIRPRHDPEVVYTEPDGNEVEGLSVDGRVVTFLVSRTDPATGDYDGTWVKRLRPDGSVRTVADLYAHESSLNPDSTTTYGFRDGDTTCDALWPADEIGAPATYTGVVDSHPYASTSRHGWTYVADAGGNDILAVSPAGRVRTVATLPGIGYTITEDVASGFGLDPCFVGRTYYFEGVPTDIETGPHGRLYVSSLPGGPEGPELGARGSIFTIDVARHRARQVVSGLLGATGVAVSPTGTLYATQMFGNEISRITFGRGGPRVSTFATPTTPGAVEWTRWGVVATTDVLSGTDGTSAPAAQLVNLGF